MLSRLKNWALFASSAVPARPSAQIGAADVQKLRPFTISAVPARSSADIDDSVHDDSMTTMMTLSRQ